MKSPDSLSTQLDSRKKRLLTRRIGAVIMIGLLSGCATKAPEPASGEPLTESSTHIDIPTYQTNEPTPKVTLEEATAAIDNNIYPSSVTSVNLFNDKFLRITEHQVYSQDNFIDLAPAMQDGVFTVVLPNKNDNPAGYSFNGTLATDSEGDIVGDILIGGHTNSGDEWIMNSIGDLEIGDLQTINARGAIYVSKVTKITHIKKTGSVHAWPGFDKALGEDGAIFACRLTKDENGNTVQSGDVTVVGIQIIFAKTVK